MTAEPTWTPSDAGCEAADPRRRLCDHICLKDYDHLDRGEPHFYGYEHPSPHTPEGNPELIPWEQVRELVEATEGACGVLYASSNQYARLRAALAPWKDNA